MIVLLLFLVPLISGLVTFQIKSESGAKTFSLLSSIVTFVIALAGIAFYTSPECWNFQATWMGQLGSSFHLKGDGLGKLLVVLTTLSFPIIFINSWNSSFKNTKNLLALMLLAQAGILGVFLAYDALLFYFFWELALIPIYFICSQWGGAKRIKITFKFFIYTFLGSLLMLVGLILIYSKTNSFSLEAFYNAGLSVQDQTKYFWILLIAFAVKIPLFPFHSWQADTYQESAMPGTMILSAIMVKMGLLGILRWVLPVLPFASYTWGDTVSTMAVIGIVYASLLAWRQDDMKRLVAFASMAHMGLMTVAIFTLVKTGIQGTLIQMFSHGINILGLWMVVEIIERKFGTTKMSELGGVAQKAPVLTFFFFVIAFANVALPLTNAFVGEYMMYSSLLTTTFTKFGIWYLVFSLTAVILSAVYILGMAKKVFWGPTNAVTQKGTDIQIHEKAAFAIIIGIILIVGVFPQPLLGLLDGITNDILKHFEKLQELLLSIKN